MEKDFTNAFMSLCQRSGNGMYVALGIGAVAVTYLRGWGGQPLLIKDAPSDESELIVEKGIQPLPESSDFQEEGASAIRMDDYVFDLQGTTEQIDELPSKYQYSRPQSLMGAEEGEEALEKVFAKVGYDKKGSAVVLNRKQAELVDAFLSVTSSENISLHRLADYLINNECQLAKRVKKTVASAAIEAMHVQKALTAEREQSEEMKHNGVGMQASNVSSLSGR